MRKMLSRVALAGVAIFALSGLLTNAASEASGGSAILEPASGALLGQFYGAGSIDQTTRKLGRTPVIHLTYYGWADDWTGSVTQADLAAGRIPLISWEPHRIDFAKIIDGSLDATIVARAKGSKALGKKFFLDFAAEMNGDEAWNGNNAHQYVAAYRHIHDLFVAAGANNVVWAWCPNVTDTDGGNRTTMDYYPGDAYVDWTGVDGYNWGTTNSNGWQTFQQVFQNIYPLLAAKKKPILIGEMASTEAGGDKAKWIDDIIPTLRTDFPLIKGVVWFDINKETDWRISSSPASEASFIRMAKDPYFNP
jgi:Glycosyl hydrolase family 26